MIQTNLLNVFALWNTRCMDLSFNHLRSKALRFALTALAYVLVRMIMEPLLAEMLVEKLGNLAERDGGLGQAIVEQVLRVRLAFVDLELRLHPSRAERAMHPHRVAQQQVACVPVVRMAGGNPCMSP